MMDYDASMQMYLLIFRICGIAAVIMLLVSIVLFIMLKIPKVFGELTGLNAKKTIRHMEEINAQTGKLVSSHKVVGKKKKMKVSKDEQEIPKAGPVVQSYRTAKMEIKTDPLSDAAVTSYNKVTERTDFHSKEIKSEKLEKQSMPLNNTYMEKEISKDFIVRKSIILIHTQEII